MLRLNCDDRQVKGLNPPKSWSKVDWPSLSWRLVERVTRYRLHVSLGTSDESSYGVTASDIVHRMVWLQ